MCLGVCVSQRYETAFNECVEGLCPVVMGLIHYYDMCNYFVTRTISLQILHNHLSFGINFACYSRGDILFFTLGVFFLEK